MKTGQFWVAVALLGAAAFALGELLARLVMALLDTLWAMQV